MPGAPLQTNENKIMKSPQHQYPRAFAFLTMLLCAGTAFAGDVLPPSAVPEPTTLSLMGFAAAACVVGAKLRKRARNKSE